MSSETAMAPDFSTEETDGKMTREMLREFISHNKIPILPTNLKDRCVDGRYNLPNPAEFPVIAKPGGTAGDVMVAFGALNHLGKSLPNQIVLDAVIESIGGHDNFSFHTDEHAVSSDAGHGMGCGHVKLSKAECQDYLLKQDQIDFLTEQFHDLLERSANQAVLQGHHAETAVVIIESEQYGLMPMRSVNGQPQQVFVYHKTLHEQQLDKLAKHLQEALAVTGEVVEEPEIRLALDQAFAIQIGATLSRLADGYPIYSVKLTQDEVHIQ